MPKPPLPRLPAQAIQDVVEHSAISVLHLVVLRWLIWLPLLSAEELARILAQAATTTAAQLLHLERGQLVEHVPLAEPGWPRHFRYYATDLGIAVFAALHPRPLSADRLARAYPVDRASLFARLAQPTVHLVLCDLVSHLLAAGPAHGFTVQSYQQPWEPTFYDMHAGQERQAKLDAAFILQDASGTSYAFYVRVDRDERVWAHEQEQDWLRTLIDLRGANLLAQETLPHVLLLSSATRYPYWADRLEAIARASTPLTLPASIAEWPCLAEGAYAPLWLPWHQLAEGIAPINTQLHSLADLCVAPASARQVEDLANSFTFAQLFLPALEAASTRKPKAMVRVVGDALAAEVEVFRQGSRQARSAYFTQAMHAYKAERSPIQAIATLALTAMQKQILSALLRHPWLCIPDLIALLYADAVEDRMVQRQLDPLLDLDFVRTACWQGTSWRERERFQLRENGLRFLAERHGLWPAHYLELPKEVLERPVSPLAANVRWHQHRVRLIGHQQEHTAGLYRCVRHILHAGRASGAYHILDWKNEYEAGRFHRDILTGESVSPSPDAELCYLAPGMAWPAWLLLEYDRATTGARELEAKFVVYADYQALTRRLLPPILVVTQSEQSRQAIERARQRVEAEEVPAVMVLESEVEANGLLAVLRKSV